MTEIVYSMSFTTAPLMLTETLRVAQLFAAEGDWQIVRAKVLDNNLLQMRTDNSSRRMFRELGSRLQQLTTAQLEFLLVGMPAEQKLLLWLAFCKRYRFVYDFAVSVIREKFLRLNYELSYHDYDLFFQDKAEWHPEVERVARATRIKQRQFLFRILRETDLLSSSDQILPAFLSSRLIDVIQADDPAHLAIFPTH